MPAIIPALAVYIPRSSLTNIPFAAVLPMPGGNITEPQYAGHSELSLDIRVSERIAQYQTGFFF